MTDDVLRLDQVLGAQVEVIAADLGAARIAEVVADLDQLVAHHLGQPRGQREDVRQIADLAQQVLVFLDDLVLLEAGQPVQAHVEDRLRLRLAQPVDAAGQAVLGGQPIRTRR